MANSLPDKAAQLIAALKADPKTLDALMEALHAELVGYTVLMIEHEWGQRDEGWSLFASEDDALAFKKKQEGPGAPGQYFEYAGPEKWAITAEVAELLKKHGRVHSREHHLPKRGMPITLDMVYDPDEKPKVPERGLRVKLTDEKGIGSPCYATVEIFYDGKLVTTVIAETTVATGADGGMYEVVTLRESK